MANIQLRNEPVGIVAAINTALITTWGVIVIVAEVGPDLAGGVALAIAAWVAVGGAIVRSRVSPV